MIVHTTLILAITAVLGVGAVPMPAPQGVTALITPGTVLDHCVINYPGVYGISIQGVGSAAAESSAVAIGRPTATGSEIVGGAVSVASAVAIGGPAEKLRRRQAVPQIPEGQIEVVPELESRAPEIPAGGSFIGHLKSWRLDHCRNLTDNCIALGKAAGPGVAPAGSAAVSGSGAAGAAGAVTQIVDRRVRAPQKRSILKARQNGSPLRVTLKGGVLTDILGRIGYIADNRQLQFDAPPQAGAIYTAGFSACPDGTLALGDSNVFYACGSSDFTNLYDTLVYPDNCREVKLFLV